MRGLDRARSSPALPFRVETSREGNRRSAGNASVTGPERKSLSSTFPDRWHAGFRRKSSSSPHPKIYAFHEILISWFPAFVSQLFLVNLDTQGLHRFQDQRTHAAILFGCHDEEAFADVLGDGDLQRDLSLHASPCFVLSLNWKRRGSRIHSDQRRRWRPLHRHRRRVVRRSSGGTLLGGLRHCGRSRHGTEDRSKLTCVFWVHARTLADEDLMICVDVCRLISWTMAAMSRAAAPSGSTTLGARPSMPASG